MHFCLLSSNHSYWDLAPWPWPLESSIFVSKKPFISIIPRLQPHKILKCTLLSRRVALSPTFVPSVWQCSEPLGSYSGWKQTSYLGPSHWISSRVKIQERAVRVKKQGRRGIIFWISKKRLWITRLHPKTISLPPAAFFLHDFNSKPKKTWPPKLFPPGSHKVTSCLQPEGQCCLNRIALVSKWKTALYQKMTVGSCHCMCSPSSLACCSIPSLIFISALWAGPQFTAEIAISDCKPCLPQLSVTAETRVGFTHKPKLCFLSLVWKGILPPFLFLF